MSQIDEREKEITITPKELPIPSPAVMPDVTPVERPLVPA